MYKNRISRTSPNRNPQFFIRRSEIAFDERVRYVESVCQVPIESRFGPGCVSPMTVNWSDRPELVEPAPLYDLSADGPDGLVPCYALSPLGRAGYQIEAAYRRAKQMGILAAGPNARNSPAALTPNQDADLRDCTRCASARGYTQRAHIALAHARILCI